MVDKILDNSDAQKELEAAAPEDKSSSALRDRFLRIVRHADLDISPEFIQAKPGETDLHLKALDGIIRTSSGYYRLAEDPETGNRILLFTMCTKNFEGAWDKDGMLYLPQDPETGKTTDDVYLVSARDKTVDGARFRQDMLEYEQYLKRNTLFELNMAMEDATPPPPEPLEEGAPTVKPLRVYKMTNSKVALGLFETEEGKWRMRLYSNMRGDWDETGRFVEIEEKIPDGFMGKKVFAAGQDYKKEFDSFGEALSEAKRYWHISAMRLWKGRSMLSELQPAPRSLRGLRNFAEKQMLGFVDQKKYRAFAITAGASLLLSVSAVLGGAIGVIGVIGAIAGAVAVKFAEDFSTGWVNNLRRKHDMQSVNRQKPASERNLAEDYADPAPGNEKRLSKKLNPEILPKLRLLSQEQARMNYDNGTYVCPNRKHWEAQVLLSMPHRVFANITVPLDDNTAITHYPNGILSLTHVDYEKNCTTNFVTYRSDFVTGKKAPLQDDIRQMLDGGKIFEICYDRKTAPHAVEVSPETLDTRLAKLFKHEAADKREKLVESLSHHFRHAARPPQCRKRLVAPAQQQQARR